MVPKVYAHYISVLEDKFECSYGGDGEEWNFHCERLTTLIVIEGTDIQGRYSLKEEGIYIFQFIINIFLFYPSLLQFTSAVNVTNLAPYIESYLGCFEADNIDIIPESEGVNFLSGCIITCEDDTFYGITGVDKLILDKIILFNHW